LPLPLPASPRSDSGPALAQPLFAVDAAEEGDTFVIRVKGELDLSQRPLLERALVESETSDARWVLLDLDQLTFIDAAGLYALHAASQRSAGNGHRLRLTRGSGGVAEMFRLTSLDLTLPFQ
jgi:anti-anti-sigma factor